MSDCNETLNHPHQHRGKSSEDHVDTSCILDALALVPDQVILDAGCGNGYMAKEFGIRIGETGKVYALDPDIIAIDILTSETVGTNITPMVADITQETPLAASSIDLIYLSNVLHGFSGGQMAGFQKEVKRLLKPKGTLAIVEFKKEDTPFGPPLAIRRAPEDLRQAIDLKSVDTVPIGQFFYMQVFEK